jgi:hypothetical protein
VEAITPELALIDPELAWAHLDRFEMPWEIRAVRPSVPRERTVTDTLVEPRWLGALKVVAALSLAANGFLASVVVSRTDAGPSASRPAAAVAVPAPPAAPDTVGTNPSVEQRILALVVRSESRRLPRALIDPVTGLPKNNLQAVCRDDGSGAQLCLVRPAEPRPGEGLYVRYSPSPDGTGNFTWYSYRSG